MNEKQDQDDKYNLAFSLFLGAHCLPAPKQPTEHLPTPEAASDGCLPLGRGVSILALKLNRAIVKRGNLQEMD